MAKFSSTPLPTPRIAAVTVTHLRDDLILSDPKILKAIETYAKQQTTVLTKPLKNIEVLLTSAPKENNTQVRELDWLENALNALKRLNSHFLKIEQQATVLSTLLRPQTSDEIINEAIATWERKTGRAPDFMDGVKIGYEVAQNREPLIAQHAQRTNRRFHSVITEMREGAATELLAVKENIAALNDSIARSDSGGIIQHVAFVIKDLAEKFEKNATSFEKEINDLAETAALKSKVNER